MKNTEFHIARSYTTDELYDICNAFDRCIESSSIHFRCEGIDCTVCPFNTKSGVECGGKSSILREKYGRNIDWRAISRRWEQAVIDSRAYIEERDRITISITESDAKVLSEYIRRTNETLAIPDAMWSVSEYVRHLIDTLLTDGADKEE